MTEGQKLALAQLRAVAAASPDALEIVEVHEPGEDGPRLRVEISLDCQGIEQRQPGVRLHERERLRIYVDPGFPWDDPSVYVSHTNWAGTPHVFWGNYLCLYQAPAVEWQPHDGMFGLLQRLELWLKRAAVSELDPAGAPLHPPFFVSSGSAPMLVVRADAPALGGGPWLGLARLKRVGSDRLDLVGWTDDLMADGDDLAPAVLLPTAMDWQYPSRVRDLIDALVDRGVSAGLLMSLLRLGSLTRPSDAGMPLIVGTPLRRLADGDPKQHLAAWYLSDVVAEGLRHSLNVHSQDPQRRELGEQITQIIAEWAAEASLSWCPIRELRPEVTERRDSQSPMHNAFAGKTVVLWGCGAIGGYAAEWIARAGAAKLILYDKAAVHPGVLARQPYVDDDIGRPKARVLAKRLRAIDPNLEVDVRVENVLNGPLERADWHDEVDILIDATASTAVASKLEASRRNAGPGETTVVAMLLGHTAERGICVIATPGHSGASSDVMRRAKLACVSRPGLGGFAGEFWPNSARSEHFQPEPGCSDATFRGSAAEVTALTGALLTAAAAELVDAKATACAHLLALPTAVHSGRRQARLLWSPDTVLHDGMGRYEIRLAQSAMQTVRAWVNRNDRVSDPRAETGGVLFGQRDQAVGVIWVDAASGPPPDSVASPAEFICGTEGVADHNEKLRARTRSSTGFVGMWHTHPESRALPSPRDIASMARLVALEPVPETLMLINGRGEEEAEFGAYVFAREDLPKPFGVLVIRDRTKPPPPSSPPVRNVGLALSGGGSRAIAFHLGCLRALNDRGSLQRVKVVSGVSGGAVAAAAYAYSDDSFADFDQRMQKLLRRGLQREIARRALLHPRAAASFAAHAASGAGALAASAASRLRSGTRLQPPIRRWASRTDAFEATLEDRLFGGETLDRPRRDNVGVIINACDLRTGSAVRFGSRESGIWRLGCFVAPVSIATAVTASAAYPLLLPSLDRSYEFARRDGSRRRERVVLTDGGVFDNLGTSCLEPGRSPQYSYNVYDVDYIVACDAGRGLLADAFPVGPLARLGRSFEAAHRKVQDASRSRLHAFVANGELEGFILPYLGQQDRELPWIPPDLVPRDDVISYPTNFAPMGTAQLETLSRRGEQLAHLLIDRWCPDL